MKYLHSFFFAAVLLCSGVASPIASASALMDDVNGSATPGFFVFFSNAGASSDANIGWVYTPSLAYNLDRIETTFRSVPNFSAFTRPVTLSIWDSHPGSGGAMLRSGSFNVGNEGGAQGISFSDLTLIAGQDYFIGLQNILGLGINIVEPLGPFPGNFANGQPAGTEFLNGWYTGPSFETFIPLATGDPQVPNNPFAAPILRFYGTAVPEPSSAMLIVVGAGLFTFVRSRRATARRAEQGFRVCLPTKVFRVR